MTTLTTVNRIKLTRGMFTIVDKKDYITLSKMKWYATGSGGGGVSRGQYHYAYTKGGKIQMHRLIMGAKKGQIVDHKNGDTLDNRRKNLRICSKIQNVQNAKMPITNKSGYKGVCLKKGSNRWAVQIASKGKKIHIGYFGTPLEGAKAYNKAARKHHGEFARLNKFTSKNV